MNTIMTNEGLLIPKEWLSGLGQFEIIREVGQIIIKSVQLPNLVSTLSEKPLNVKETFNQQVVADKSVTTDNSAAVPMDAEYAEAMRSYLSRQAQRISDPSQPYPTRDSLYDRNVLRGQ